MRLKPIHSKLLLLSAPFLAIIIAVLMLLYPVVQESDSPVEYQTMYDSTVNLKRIDNEAKGDHYFQATHHPAWKVKEVEYVPEYKINVVTYTHKKTKGELVSFHEDKSEIFNPSEQEKVFGVFMRTPVPDSTGVPHILEHSVLCGSRKFKTKEPFADIMQTSLNTFLNAFTWDDRTGFAFASCNTQDFKNSLDVYLDAVFHPRVRNDKFVLAQEGWHLRPKEGAAVSGERQLAGSEMTLSGVVYSEMKGVYSDVDSLLFRRLQQHTFPDTPYRFDSGGDPKDIPSLTFDQFAEFYDKHYHPSNAVTYVSGMDQDEHDFLSTVDGYYKEYDAAPEKRAASVVQVQKKRFTEPVREKYPYSVGDDNGATHIVATNWLINDTPMSAMQGLAWGMLNRLLLGASSSILYKSLSESGFGNQVLDYGYEDELVQATFAVGLKGVKEADVKKVEHLTMNTLRQVAKDGFDDDTIEASLNFIEFHLRENESSGDPKGLEFMFASMSKYNYGYSPTEGLKFEKALGELKANIKQSKSQIFKDLINDYLLNNNHRVILDFYPDAKYEENQAKEEQDRINAYVASLSKKEAKAVIDFAHELTQKQTTPDSEEAKATIPKLSLDKVERSVVDYPNKVDVLDNGVTVVSHTLPTAGILYADVAIDISKLSLKVASEKLPLYMAFLTQTGTDKLSEVKLRELIEMHTGGVGASTLISQVKDSSSVNKVVLDGTNWVTKLLISGKSLTSKADKLFDIIHTILTESKLDNQKKASELLKSSCTSQESSIASSGNSYARTRLHGRYNVAGAISEKMNGVTSYEDCKVLLKQVNENWPKVLEDLNVIRSTLMDKETILKGLIINLTGEEETLNAVHDGLNSFIAKLTADNDSDASDISRTVPLLATLADTVKDLANPQEDDSKAQHPWLEEAFKLLKTNQGNPPDEAVLVPTQVSYVAKGNKVYKVGETVHGSSSVITSWLSTVYLWNTVRIQGNAYGAGGSLDDDNGVFSCVSYRDPNIQSTLKFYDGIVPWLKKQASELKNKDAELKSAIIGALKEGSPPSNSQKGTIAFNRWLLGYTTEGRQHWKDEIFETKPEDFEEFAKKLEDAEGYSTVIVTSDALYKSSQLPNRSVIKIDGP